MSAWLEQAPGGTAGKDHLNILVVRRDDPAESALLQELMRRPTALVAWERDLRHARAALAVMNFDVVVTDTHLPDGSGLSLIADPAGRLQRWGTILLAGVDDPQLASEARKRGAIGVVDSHAAPEQLLEAIARARDLRRETPAAPLVRRDLAAAAWQPAAAAPGEAPLLGDSPAMRQLRLQLQRIAPVPIDVLVIGETGSGKDLVARQLHARSGRQGAFVAVNCGAIPEALFESELFGHEAGAFTGAGKARVGLIEQSHQGTLFLDEIESMPLSQQVKLLRVLETRSVGRVGGRGERPLDLRIVAAAQHPLEARCRAGLFRDDLRHRLDVATLQVAPLRERRADIGTLFAYHVQQACVRFGLEPSAVAEVDLQGLLAHDWPGNVRELRHAAERHALGLPMRPGTPVPDAPRVKLAEELGRCERELIRAALDRHGRLLRAAAAELGISEKTLTRRIAAYGMGRDGGCGGPLVADVLPPVQRYGLYGSDTRA